VPGSSGPACPARSADSSRSCPAGAAGRRQSRRRACHLLRYRQHTAGTRPAHRGRAR
jgi:hypothetical protein